MHFFPTREAFASNSWLRYFLEDFRRYNVCDRHLHFSFGCFHVPSRCPHQLFVQMNCSFKADWPNLCQRDYQRRWECQSQNCFEVSTTRAFALTSCIFPNARLYFTEVLIVGVHALFVPRNSSYQKPQATPRPLKNIFKSRLRISQLRYVTRNARSFSTSQVLGFQLQEATFAQLGRIIAIFIVLGEGTTRHHLQLYFVW